MDAPKTYCDFVNSLTDNTNLHKLYHDNHYGFPILKDDELFCRLVLEINQAGLSWTTILTKQDNFRKAYDNFSIKKVAAYTEADIERLMNDAGIIRNRLKINAAIYNANIILGLKEEFGSFRAWLNRHHPKTKKEWTVIFKRTFKFTGGEIVNEFLTSTGYLKGAHSAGCPVHLKVIKANPAWNQAL